MTKMISYIFPVLNCEGSLDELYKQVREVMAPLSKKYDYEFIFINDGSTDKSPEIMAKLAKQDKKVVVLTLSRNFGHQAAVTAGLDYATGDAVIIMDTDLQDPPAVCARLIKKWEDGFEVVYAQRRSRKDSFLKKFTADLYYRMLSSLSSVDIPRNTGDFRLVDRKVVDVVKEMKEYHRFLRGMFSFTGFKQAPVLFDRHARVGGTTQYTLKKMMRLAKDGVFGFSDAPLRFVTRFGFIIALLSVVGVLYALASKLFFTTAVPGWTMIAVAIFFMGGVQLVMLGIVGEYIARIYNEVRNRPIYIVADTVNTKKAG